MDSAATSIQVHISVCNIATLFCVTVCIFENLNTNNQRLFYYYVNSLSLRVDPIVDITCIGNEGEETEMQPSFTSQLLASWLTLLLYREREEDLAHYVSTQLL